MTVSDAYSLVSRAIDAGHAAHGYLVCGDLAHGCGELAELVLRKLFPNELAQIENRCHPDVVYLEPEGKSRTIPRHVAFRNIEAVEEASRRTDKYMGDEAVLCAMADRMTWP